MEIPVVTADIAQRCILFGACSVPKVGTLASEMSSADLIWAERIFTPAELEGFSRPLWTLSGYGDGAGFGDGDDFGFGFGDGSGYGYGDYGFGAETGDGYGYGAGTGAGAGDYGYDKSGGSGFGDGAREYAGFGGSGDGDDIGKKLLLVYM